jgi:hypothetical protein
MESEAIFRAISTTNTVIVSHSDALQYLKSSAPKDPTFRAIAWLVILDLVHPSTPDSSSDIVNLVANYRTILSTNFPPLRDRDEEVIAYDVPRCVPWFQKFADELSLDLQIDSAAVIVRVLRTLLGAHKIVYFQGFDRFLFISYLVALKFTFGCQLDSFVAEAVTFSLSGRLLAIADFPQRLRPESIEAFRKIDDEVCLIRPDIARELNRCGHSAIHYAQRWKLLWFADEHSIEGIWMIWDNLIARIPELELYLDKLCIAHITQIQLSPDCLALETIQSYRGWDVPAIIEAADNVVFTPDTIINLGPEIDELPPEPGRLGVIATFIRQFWYVWLLLLVLMLFILARDFRWRASQS